MGLKITPNKLNKFSAYLTNNIRWCIAVLLIGIMLSLALSAWRSQENDRLAHQQLSLLTSTLTTEIKEKITLYQYGLRGLRGFVATSYPERLTRDSFLRYSLTRDYKKEFPGARGFGFIRRVPQVEVTTFIALAQRDNWPSFSIRELTPNTGERYIIQYIHPADTNSEAIGLDIASEINRRTAAYNAIKTGEVQLTGPITLVQATGKPKQSFLILMPIYLTKYTPDTVEMREKNAFGWSFAPLITEEILTGFNLDPSLTDIVLTDVTANSKPIVFFESTLSTANQTVLNESQQVSVFGRQWKIDVAAYPEYIKQMNLPSPTLTLIIGLLISLLTSLVIYVFNINRLRKEQLFNDQAYLAAIVTSSSEGIVAENLDGVVTKWNKGAAEIFGFREDEVVGNELLGMTLPEELKHEKLNILDLVEHENKTAPFETERLCKDGRRINVSITISPILDSTGKVIGTSKTIRDITNQKRIEAEIKALNTNLEAQVLSRTTELQIALKENQLLLDTINQQLNYAVFDINGNIVEINAQFSSVLGYSTEQIIGKDCVILNSASHSKEFWQDIWDSVSMGKSWRGEISATSLTGELKWFDAIVTPFVNLNNDIDRYVLLCTDVSKQHQDKYALEKLSEQLSIATDLAGLGIWSWQLADNSLQWNDRMFDIYQQPIRLKNNGLDYGHWLERLHPEDKERNDKAMNGLVEGTGNYDLMFRIILPDASIRYIQASAQTTIDQAGNVLNVTGMNLDITQQQNYEAQMQDAKEQADAASNAKSSFVANMSHEIRTPMNGILGMLQLVKNTQLAPNQQDYIDKAQSAAKSLLRLLNDILDFSKIDAGKLSLDCHPFEVETLLSDLGIIIGGNLHDKNIEVLFDIDPTVPNILVGDSLRLQQILINLVGNAIKFTESGNITVAIKLLSTNTGQAELRFSVIDTGMGISPEQAKNIFDGFVQAESSISRRFGGTGLGLVICRNLVQLMGGELQLESELGNGSRFWFDVTLEKSNNDTLKDAISSIKAHLHILIVDDNDASKHILANTVESLGWSSDQASSGQEAIDKIIHADEIDQPYELILMDWRMPDLDGVATAEKINGLNLIHKRSIIIMVTAFGREALNEKQFENAPPFKALLTKPVTPLQLINTIQQTLGVEPSNQNSPTQPSSASKKSLTNLRILLVEDNALNRQIANELLVSEGAIVDLAHDGLEAINKVLVEDKKYEIVIMDIQMPNMDGLEATRRIRADVRFQDLPILAMTANASVQDRELSLASGMNSHIGKPIDLNLLITEILALTNVDKTADLLNLVANQDQTLAVDHDLDEIEPFDIILNRCNGDQALLQKIFDLFVPSMANLLNDLVQAKPRDDFKTITSTLHTIKGMAATMGAKSLANYAMDIEKELKRSNSCSSLDQYTINKLDQLYLSSVSQIELMIEQNINYESP